MLKSKEVNKTLKLSCTNNINKKRVGRMRVEKREVNNLTLIKSHLFKIWNYLIKGIY